MGTKRDKKTYRAAISAHRGGSEEVMAATLEAYRGSIETGAEYVEFDIRRIADGDYVSYHDERVDHVGRPLAELNYKELCKEADYVVPRVSEIMEIIRGRAIGHLDLKEIGHEAEIISMARDILGEDQFIATTLEDESVARIKKFAPDVVTALSLGRPMDGFPPLATARVRLRELFPLKRIRSCGADWVAVHHKLADATVLRICARHQIPAMVWTVNEDDLIKELLADSRVGVLITDRPKHAVSMRASLSDYKL